MLIILEALCVGLIQNVGAGSFLDDGRIGLLSTF